MTAWDTADLLSRFNRRAGRATTDAITNPTKYQILSEAQEAVFAEIAARYPQALFGAPATLTTSDQQVYTFGNDDDGNPLAPMGAAIYRALRDIPGNPLRRDVDYQDEGTQIRWPNNRTGPATLYWQGVKNPEQLAADVEPVLRPAPARVLILIKAIQIYGGDGNRRPDLVSAARTEWALEFPKWMLVWKRRFKVGGAVSDVDVVQLFSSGIIND